MQYIDVIIDNKSIYTDTCYTYSTGDEVTVGSRLTVPFAGRKKPVDAYCVAAGITPDFDLSKVKEISEFDETRSLNAEMIETAVWMRKRYGVKYIDAIKMFGIEGKREKTYKAENHSEPRPAPYELTKAQLDASKKICGSIDKGESKVFLIKGVTNSGKTEVYMSAVEKALSIGKTAIVLLPEIALSMQVADRFRDRFGSGMIATLHSRLRKSERLSEWLRIRRGEAKIVIGARTSVFAPLDNIGVIVIDEEHESTYKSDHNPKYDTIDIAYKRASLSGACLVLGSATPSIVSFYRAKTGIYELIEMKDRIGSSIMPGLEITDLKEELKCGNQSVLSRALASGIDRALSRNEQVILFLNRRGYSTRILCPDCGYKMTCPDCGITLTYHKRENAAICHYCGRKFPVPDTCPDCGSTFIKYIGAGTEKVEEEASKLWPGAGIARFDIDTASSDADAVKVIEDFQAGKTDILVGTQILAKGLDFKNVGLVGIINADVSLNIPDYRSPEKTYQLITQVAGRAGRAGGESRVIIQTYEPDSDIIKEAASGDYEAFYESELIHRSIMNYPPYSDIISVVFNSEYEEVAASYAEAFRKRLLTLKDAPEGADILRIRQEDSRTDGRARIGFIIKAPQGSRAGYVAEYMSLRDRLIEQKAPVFAEIDVNPYGMV